LTYTGNLVYKSVVHRAKGLWETCKEKGDASPLKYLLSEGRKGTEGGNA